MLYILMWLNTKHEQLNSERVEEKHLRGIATLETVLLTFLPLNLPNIWSDKQLTFICAGGVMRAAAKQAIQASCGALWSGICILDSH